MTSRETLHAPTRHKRWQICGQAWNGAWLSNIRLRTQRLCKHAPRASESEAYGAHDCVQRDTWKDPRVPHMLGTLPVRAPMVSKRPHVSGRGGLCAWHRMPRPSPQISFEPPKASNGPLHRNLQSPIPRVLLASVPIALATSSASHPRSSVHRLRSTGPFWAIAGVVMSRLRNRGVVSRRALATDRATMMGKAIAGRATALDCRCGLWWRHRPAPLSRKISLLHPLLQALQSLRSEDSRWARPAKPPNAC